MCNVFFACSSGSKLSCDYRFTQTFDSDRSKLSDAYAEDALFSCRTVDGSLVGPLSSSYNVAQDPTEIVKRLQGLGTFYFEPRGMPMREAHYDLAMLPRNMMNDEGAGLGSSSSSSSSTLSASADILATLHTELVNPGTDVTLDQVLTVDQSFVLRRAGVRVGVKADWGLVIVSHQVVIRKGSILPFEKLEASLPWFNFGDEYL